MVGGAITVRVSVAVPPVPPSVELTVPVVLTCAPALMPVTLTENVHDEAGSGDAVNVPPDKLTVDGVPGGLPIVAVIAPLPHEPVTVVEANFKPPGNVSVNATPLSALTVFGLVSVKLRVLLPFNGMVLGLNALLMVGGAITVSVSDAVPPVPPSVELTVLVVLTCVPTLIPVTLTENVHEDPAAGDAVNVPPDKLTVDGVPGGLLIVAVMVPLPHEPVTVVEASFTPPGNESVKATPLNALAVLGLVTVKLNVLLLFSGTLLGLNALLMVGGATTIKVSLAVPPVPPSVELTVPVVFNCAPALIPVTLTENVHEDPAAGDAVNVPPDKLTVEGDPGGLLIVAVMVPLPQEPVTVVEASFTPPGNESVNATPLSALAVLGLVTVKLRVLLPPNGTLFGLNDLLIVGGATIVIFAVPAVPEPAVVSLAVTLLFATPAAVPCTLTETVQLAPGARLELARATEPEPGVAVAPPLQLSVRLLGVATTKVPVVFGSASVKVMALSVWFWLGLLTWMLRLVVPFNGIVARPKFLAMLGGLITLSVSDAVLPLPAAVESMVTLLL